MEAHPVPQNVTSFQFKLVGDMTIKQFAYLASGIVVAYILFIFLTPSAPIIAWPLIIMFSLTGAAFAFLPIGYRSLDYWLIAFLRAVYSPTKQTWSKNNKGYGEEPLFKSRLTMFLSPVGQPSPITNPPIPALRPLTSMQPNNTPPIFAPKAEIPFRTVPQPEPKEALPSQEELQKTVELAKEAQNLQIKIIENERKLNQIKEAAGQPQTINVDYSREIANVLANLQQLINQASEIKQRLADIDTTQPTIPLQEQPKERVKITVTTPQKPKQTQLMLTTFPNVINGIVKDSENNYLEGVVVVIYDKEGLPVRALKTNKLGQFSGSTPLPNGVYTIELEKDNLVFDALQIELVGSVIPPLAIAAKKVIGSS